VRLALGLLAAYLLGSIPTSFWVGRAVAGIDLREHGSKNLGATNLFRVLGWKYAIPVGMFDVLKGALPVLVIAPRVGGAPWVPVLLGATAVFGHVYSIFAGFRGGKGVATAAGTVAALAPFALLASAVVWSVVVLVSGYVSLGSILGAVAFPVTAWILQPGDQYTVAAGAVLAAFIVFTHRANIRRLLQGTESRFRQKPAAS
jgi:glycerol-3-phosphate acyltransferase PlsY